VTFVISKSWLETEIEKVTRKKIKDMV
jgi:hypothetical protein